jgi:hypothetical protein
MIPYKSTFQEAQKSEGLTLFQTRSTMSKVYSAIHDLGEAIDIIDKVDSRSLTSDERKTRKTLLDVTGKLKQINL